MHPSWNGRVENGSDIALLQLEKPLQGVPMPSMATESLKLPESLTLTVVGWPQQSNRGPTTQALQHADIPFVSNSNCQNVYNMTILDAMLCAGGSKIDACKGREFTNLFKFEYVTSSSCY